MAPISAQREKRVVGTSLKMYFDLNQTHSYIQEVAKLAQAAEAANVDLFVLPDFVSIPAAQKTLANTSVALGAQNCASQAEGAYTGEVSARVLKQAGVKIVAVGHAERRQLYGETDQDVAQKAALVAGEGMVPLVCIGEREQSRVASQAVGIAVSECKTQMQAALQAVPEDADLIFAYEPVWAIGASQPASADHVVAVTQNLRSLVAGRSGRTRILYGGAAGPGTFRALKDGVDGLFLARFAHDISNLEKVIEEMA